MKNDKLEKFNQTLDELITLEREEQELILNRKTDQLIGICSKIDHLSMELERQQEEVSTFLQKNNGKGEEKTEKDSLMRLFREKYMLIQNIAVQNQVLLEHSSTFLEEIFREVLGQKAPLNLYNHLGILNKESEKEKGVLLDAKI